MFRAVLQSVVVVVVLAGVAATEVEAQSINSAPRTSPGDARVSAGASLSNVSLRNAIAPIVSAGVEPTAVASQSAARVQPQRSKSPWRRVAGAAVGGVGGFFGGLFLGAAIEGDGCHCDDPGLKGAIIGAPIGAVAGGILGGLYLF